MDISRSIFLIVECLLLSSTFHRSSCGLPHHTNEETQREQFHSSSLEEFLGAGEDNTEFSVVHPIRLDDSGMFLTHDVRYVSPLDHEESSSRKRRHVDVNRHLRRGSRLLYSVPFGDQVITVNLTENDKLVQDNFVIEKIKAGNSTFGAGISSSLSQGTQWPCHFRGHVEGQPGSRVALSTCHGLTGLLVTDKGDYFIEPLKVPKMDSESSTMELTSQPHKIYRRDLGSFIDRAEPLLNLKKVVTSGKKTSRSQDDKAGSTVEHKSRRDGHSDVQNPFSFFESQEDFCGVTDTRRKYRRMIKRREQWESKRNRLYGYPGKAKKDHGERRRSRRPKRSVSVERMIEMLVVVDKKMVEYYEAYDHGSVERYVLTIINMVSELFHDASIGNSLHVSLVRLILLEDEEAGLKISQHAEKTLDSFCKWAKKINPKGDDHPNHHDVAVLLTRRDICSNSNKSCETLGLAHVAGMCQSHRSCNVNQDTGLSLAYTVAHELGHNFAMHHDGQLNDCKSSAKYNHVMAPHLTSSSLAMKWSSCSRRYITRFLDRNWGFCLNDQPADHDFDMPTSLPGTIYDADHQCRLMFGDKSRHCYGIDDACDRLWCYVGGTCRSRLHAAVAGTKCGKGKWCFAGKCVHVGKRPKAIDGGWGDWSVWSPCSRTCGIGVSYSMRHCDNPVPRSGGKYCLSERKRYRTCSKWKCRKSEGVLNFREQQCAAFNNVKYKNMTFNWKPVDSPLYPCELHCYTRAGKIPFADRLSDKVIDGTKCFPGSDDICVDGICRRVGCDKNIGSRALEDRCGVCHGDGSSCDEIKKLFSRKKGEEYTPVGLLPRGARNIIVGEVKSAANFLALRNATNKTDFFLNGNYMIQWDTKFQLAGTQFTYNRLNETTDNITAPGPLQHDIMIMILFVEENPGVSISYTMPHNVTHSLLSRENFPEFTWIVQEWGKCSRECGNGEQVSTAVCEEKTAGIIEDFFCNETMRPTDKRRGCNEVRCPPRWWAAPWQTCSVTCGADVGVQHRVVICVRSVGEDEQIALNHTECFNMTRPVNKRRCTPTTEIPCPVWRADEWGQCSKTCGSGIANRTVQCVTYIMNDVINLDLDFDEDFIDFKKKVTKPPRIKGFIPGLKSVNYPKYPKHHGIKISNKIIPEKEDNNILNGKGVLVSTEVDPIQRSLDNDLDGYDVEDDALCDHKNRPVTKITCNTYTCPAMTSTVGDTEAPTEISTEQFVTTVRLEKKPEAVTGYKKPRITTSVKLDKETTSKVSRKDSATTPDKLITTSGHVDIPTTDLAPLLSGLRTQPPNSTNMEDDMELPEEDYTPDDEFDLDEDAEETTLPEIHPLPVEDEIEDKDEFDIDEMSISTPPPTTTEVNSFPPSGGSTKMDEVTKKHYKTEKMEMSTRLHKTVTTTPDIKSSPRVDEFDIEYESDNNKRQIKIPETQKKNDNELLDFDMEKKEIDIKSSTESPITMEVPKLRKLSTNTPPTTSHPTQSTVTTTLKYEESTTEPIKAEWIAGNWSKCSTTCGVGAMFRRVQCSHELSLCDKSHRPAPAKICNLGPCAKWVYGEWNKCSTLCGSGIRSKKTECVDQRTEKVLRPHHCTSLVPLEKIEISCRENQCMPWKTSRWTTCSSVCGPGTQRRRTACSRHNQCDSALRPHEKKSCFLEKCVEWRPLEWNRCSVHCGGGLQYRGLICVEQATGHTTNSSECNPDLVPKKIQKCNVVQCPFTDYDFSSCHADRLSTRFCELLYRLGKCVQPSLAIQCCVTCKTYTSVRHKDKIS